MAELDVAYVLLRFPSLTETFVAEEMRHLQLKGINLQLYSLLHSRDQIVHPVAQELLPQTHYAPGALSWALWLAQAYYLVRHPRTYLRLLVSVLREPAPHASFLAKRFVVFLKGVWLARQLEQSGVRLIHVHFAWLPVVAAFVASRLLELPFTVTAHAYDIYSERNDLLRLAAAAAQRIVTISEVNKRAILGLHPGLAPSMVTVLHCGIDLDSFQPPAQRPPHQALEITSVGSLLAKKGHEYLIRACRELQAQGVDFQCTIVGRGELEQSLRRLIAELGLDGKVVLAGAQSQEWVRQRLRDTDVFVLACVGEGNALRDRDGIPVALMEAMATGIPVITTLVSGIPELVCNEETGLLVAERDGTELARAIRRLAGDELLRSRLAQNGRQWVAAHYNIATNTGRLRDIFKQVIQAGYPGRKALA